MELDFANIYIHQIMSLCQHIMPRCWKLRAHYSVLMWWPSHEWPK